MISDLTLLSGNDIPFYGAQVSVHQPTVKEIGFLGEENFFTGCEVLNFSKDSLTEEDKSNLEGKTNFDILIAILRENSVTMQKNRSCVEMVLALIFPEYEINISYLGIELKKQGEEETHIINNDNFDEFKIILNSIFAYKKSEGEDTNPIGDMAKKIADKLKQGHQRLAQEKGENKKIDIISRYVSILAVGQQKDMNSLLNYTVYQLFDEFERYELKVGYDIFIQAKMAGAKDLKDVEDWMKDIHSKNK